MPVAVTVHAILRYAERALKIDVEGVRRTMTIRDRREITDSDVMAYLIGNGIIDKDAIVATLSSSVAVRVAANMAGSASIKVVTNEGRIVICNNTVMTFHELPKKSKMMRSRREMLDEAA